MEKARRKKAVPVEADEGAVEVRVSARAPRALPAATTFSRTQSFAVGMLEALIGQIADYVESSPAVERLIRVQTAQVLRELAREPQLTALLRAQAEQYLAEVAAKPEILEPIVRVQVDRYLDHLLNDNGRIEELSERLRRAKDAPPRKKKVKPRVTKMEIE